MECKGPDGLSKYHCKYWQLCLVPCLTPLIHLPLPLSFSIASLFQSMLLFFCDPFSSVHWCCIPSSHPTHLPPPPLLLSLRLSRVTPTDACLYFRPILCPWTLGCSVFWRGWDSEILKCMRSHMAASEMDRFLSRNKCLHHPQTEDTLRLCLQSLETADQLQIKILIQDIFNSLEEYNTILCFLPWVTTHI